MHWLRIGRMTDHPPPRITDHWDTGPRERTESRTTDCPHVLSRLQAPSFPLSRDMFAVLRVSLDSYRPTPQAAGKPGPNHRGITKKDSARQGERIEPCYLPKDTSD